MLARCLLDHLVLTYRGAQAEAGDEDENCSDGDEGFRVGNKRWKAWKSM